MKKNLFYLFALICSMSLFTACSDDDEVNTDLNTAYVSSELELTYGGKAFAGKKVTFNTTDGKNADITLEGANISLTPSSTSAGLANPGVIPGEPKVTFSVALQPVGNGYAFEGEHSTNNYTMTYKGAVEKGKLTLGLDVKLLSDNALVGSTWNLGDYNPWGTDSPFCLVWDSKKMFSVVLLPFPGAELTELQPGGFLTLMTRVGLIPVGEKKANLDLNQALACLLESVTFMKDGNIVASYSDAADMASPKFKDSPLNMVQYVFKDKKLYLYLNMETIMGIVQKSTTKGLDIATILPIVMPKLLELLPMLSNGIPLGYTIADNKLSVYIDNELGLKIRDILLSLLGNKEIVAAIKEAATSNPDFATYAGMMDAVLEQAPEVLAGTTKMELGLNLKK